MNLNSARIEVLLEEVIRKIKTSHDQYLEALNVIDQGCNISNMDREEFYRLLNTAVDISCQSLITLVRNQIDLSLEEDRKQFYCAQLSVIEQSIERTFAIPISMKQARLLTP